jgi:Amidohydrolase
VSADPPAIGKRRRSASTGPTQLSDAGRRIHLDRLAELAAKPNVATRLDVVGTTFGAWTAERLRPWLVAVVDLFGPDRCMLGSDLPIERLRSGFEPLYRATTRCLPSTHRATASCCWGPRRSGGTGPTDRRSGSVRDCEETCEFDEIQSSVRASGTRAAPAFVEDQRSQAALLFVVQRREWHLGVTPPSTRRRVPLGSPGGVLLATRGLSVAGLGFSRKAESAGQPGSGRDAGVEP